MPRRPRSNVQGITAAEGNIRAQKLSAYWKAKWAEPGYREKRKANPEYYTRLGVPHGIARDEAELMKAEATQWVDEWMKELEDAGILLTDGKIVPGSDEAIAKASIREAAIIALSPGAKKDKLAALSLCLAYTKQKPISKVEAALKKPEDWLAGAIAASKADADKRD